MLHSLAFFSEGKKHWLWWLIVLIELIAIVILLLWLYEVLQRPIQGSPIVKEDVTFPSSDLAYFFEPTANSDRQHLKPDWLEENPVYRINSDALREDKEYSQEKASSTFRVVSVGDSFTYGLFVNVEESYPKQLEERLNAEPPCMGYQQYEVINLGVDGYDLDFALERYERRGEKYNPDLIIWYMVKNDFVESANWQYQQFSQLQQSNSSLDNNYSLWRQIRREFQGQFTDQEIVDFQLSHINEFRSLSKVPLVIYTQADTRIYQSTIKSITAKVPSVTLLQHQVFLERGNTMLPDGHPNPLGYETIATYLYNFIKTNNCEF